MGLRVAVDRALSQAARNEFTLASGSMKDRLECLSRAQLIAAERVAQHEPDLDPMEAVRTVVLSEDCARISFGRLDASSEREAMAYWDSAAGIAKLGVLEATGATGLGHDETTCSILRRALDARPTFA